jgi:hypothetical protein
MDLEVGPSVPNLSDPSTRERLTPSAVDGVVRLGEIWRLTGPEVCALLGDVSERTWFRMKKGEWSGTPGHPDKDQRADWHLQGPSFAVLRTAFRRMGATAQQRTALRRPTPARYDDRRRHSEDA